VALGRALVALRRERGWTVEEAAGRFGVEPAFVRRIEAGRTNPSLAVIVSIAKAYGVPLQALLRDPGPDADGSPVEGRRHETSARAAALGALAAGVAHDVNNMLAVVLTFADVLAERLAPGTTEASALEDLLVAARRASNLIRQWLSIGRRGRARPQRLDLGVVFDGIAPMLRILAGGDAEVRIVAAAGLWPVRADRGRVEEILMNLVTNARDAMGGAGTVYVDSANVETAAGPQVVLRVRDSGLGMDETTMARIFEPFFTTKEPEKGSGVGLAVVKGLVEEMGGTIHVTSEPGKGSTFCVYLAREEENGSP
jgi:two-component system cell cycle sensor histidine kinase/response regulator CckA